MQIYSVLKLGQFHPIFCEDFTFHSQLNEDWVMIAVMDGCSSGINSHFTSTLFGKILKKSPKTFHTGKLKTLH